MAVSIQQEGMPSVSGETVDISEGGIALRVPTPLTPGAEATVQFTLPGTQLPIRAEVKVCWYNEACQAGLSFLALSPDASAELQGWIACRFEVQLADWNSSEPRSCGELIQTRLP